MKNIFAVYKPKGPTSHDIIDEIRKFTGIKKVGHAGTLDPLAEGVLVVGIGREATKQLSTEVQKEKEYIAKICLGETTETDDSEGGPYKIELRKYEIIEKKEIEELLVKLIGKIEQIPPKYSAIKIKGKSAYKYARQGHEIVLKPRTVEIKEIELVDFVWPILTLRVVTGPGVYIRSLARDIGDALHVGGYLAGLERTRVGEFTVTDCIPLNEIKNKIIL